jgi:hypothetical protein
VEAVSVIKFGTVEWVDEVAALATEIYQTTKDMHGGIDGRFWREAAWQQAYGQIDELLEYAVAWDERAVWAQFGLALAAVREGMV